MVHSPAEVLDRELPDDVFLSRLSLHGVQPKKRTLDVAIFDRKIYATFRKNKSTRTPAAIRCFAHLRRIFVRISKAPHHPLHAELQDALGKRNGMREFLTRVVDHPELLETVPAP